MSRSAWFTSVFVTLLLAAAFIVLSESHSWSSSATTWGLTAIFGAPTAIDIALLRWRKRSSRRRGGGGSMHPAK
jgi:hypothetical protein